MNNRNFSQFPILAVVWIVVAVIFILSVGFLITSNNSKPSSHSGATVSDSQIQATSLIVNITCTGCLLTGQGFSSQFYGSFGDSAGSVSVNGNGSMYYSLARNGEEPWTIDWNVQKNSMYGTLEIVITLNTGLVIADNSTSSSFGVLQGFYST